MLLSLVPVALAEGEETVAKVARIGEKEYETLAAAVEDVPTDKTETEIVLLDDYTGSGIQVVEGKNIVFNLNGKTYTVNKPTVGSTGTETNGFQLLKGSKVTFKNGTLNSVTGEDSLPNGGILIQNYCELTLENVTLDTSANSNIYYVISNNFGSLTAKGNTVIKAAAGKVAFDLWYGMNRDGLYDDGVSVAFGGDFTGSVTGKIEYGAADRAAAMSWKEKTVLTVAGGSFNTTIVDSNSNDNVTAENFNISISGGTFTSDVSAYVAAGYEVANAGGTYTVKLKDEAKVAAIDEQGYPTLAEAVAAANGKTVKLLKGVTEAITIPAGKTITLDLNGHKLVNSATAQDKDVADASRKHTITNNGTLTILDSVGNGVVDNVSHGRAAIYNAGTITEIKGGKFTRSVDNSTDATSAKGNSWYVVYNAEKATINSISGGEFLAVGKFSSLFCNCGTIGEISGGTFKQDGFIAFKNEGTVNKISGGTFASENESCIQNWGTIGEITGGTITAGSIGIWNFSSDKYESVGKVGKISGGNISGSTAAIRLNDYDATYLNKPSTTNKASVAVSGGNISGNLQINANTEFSVTGGTFSVNPIDYVQKGYAVTKVKDNEFTVAPVKDTAAVEVTNNSDAGKTSVQLNSITPDGVDEGKTNTIDIRSLDTDKGTNEVVATKTVLNEIIKTDATRPVEFKLAEDLNLLFNVEAVKAIAQNMASVTGNIILTVTPNATVTGTELTAKNSVANDKSRVVTITLTGGASGATPAELYAAATAKGKVTITVPFDMTGYNRLNVYYLDPTTGKAVHVGRATYDTNAGTATFDVEHFSSYVLVPGKSSSGSGGSGSGSGSVGSGAHTVTSDLTGTITKVTVDGKTVASKHYTVSGGNVTFTEAFMKTLSNGTHKVTIETATKIARGTFTVDNGTKPVVSSKTGDAGIALYAGMAIASVMGGGLVLTSRKRRSH